MKRGSAPETLWRKVFQLLQRRQARALHDSLGEVRSLPFSPASSARDRKPSSQTQHEQDSVLDLREQRLWQTTCPLE